MPLFLFLVEVPGAGLGDSESSSSENKQGRAWVVGYFYDIFAIVIMVYDLQMFIMFFLCRWVWAALDQQPP